MRRFCRLSRVARAQYRSRSSMTALSDPHQHLRSPVRTTDHCTMSSCDILNRIDCRWGCILRSLQQWLCVQPEVAVIFVRQDVSTGNISPASICGCAECAANTPRLELFCPRLGMRIRQIVVENLLRVFYCNRGGTMLQLSVLTPWVLI